MSAEESSDMGEVEGWVVGASAGGLALLIILLFFVLLFVILKKFRKIERHLDIEKSAGGHKRRNDVETSQPIALTETDLTKNKDPDTQKPSTVEPMYSNVKKKRPSVKVEQYSDFGGPELGEQSLAHNPESNADTKPPVKSTPWTVKVDFEGYSHLRHASTSEQRRRPHSNSNRFSMPIWSEQTDEEGGVSGNMAQPYIAPVWSTSQRNDAEGTPPPIPNRLSSSMELLLESNDKEGDNSGKGPTRYQHKPQKIVNEILYDEVSHTAPAKVHPVYDAPAPASNKTDFGPETLYDEIKH